MFSLDTKIGLCYKVVTSTAVKLLLERAVVCSTASLTSSWCANNTANSVQDVQNTQRGWRQLACDAQPLEAGQIITLRRPACSWQLSVNGILQQQCVERIGM